MSKAFKLSVVLGMVLVLGAAAMVASAATQFEVRTSLSGYREVPAISTTANGTFRAEITTGNKIKYRLRYADVEGVSITQAHIHFGQKDVNGGITVFLCSNLGNGPAGTPACPASPGEVTGTLTADDMVGLAAAQGIAAGEFGELRRAIRLGFAYVNIHSETYTGGEARGQLRVVD
jgi:CHRD domain